MKLLVYGHWSHTGFGVVTEALATRFVAAGIDVRVLAVNHRGEPVQGPLTGRVWPLHLMRQQFNANISPAALSGVFWSIFDPTDEWVPDQILAIADHSGLLDYIGQAGLPAWEGKTAWHYCPIEGDNLPVTYGQLWQTVAPVAMSEYGRGIMAETMGHDVPMVYHGVDTESFHPVGFDTPIKMQGMTLTTKRACKAAFDLDPDGILIFRADRLVERKFYDAFLKSVTPVLAANHKVSVLIHCRPQDDGLDLGLEIARMPTEVQDRVKLTGMHDTFRGLPTTSLAALYNAADIYVSTTSGEGFGLTLAEAAACGVPVVTTDHAAGPEVVGPGGILVPPLKDEHGDEVAYHSRYQMDWRLPNVPAFTAAIQRLVDKPQERKELGRLGRAHVVKSFNWDRAAAQFIDIFDGAAESKAA